MKDSSFTWRDLRLPLLIGAALALVTLVPYIYAAHAQAPGRVFMGFFFLGDDANTYLAKMHQGWEGSWIWHNRYTTEPSYGIYFFTFWIALGHLARALSLSLPLTFQLARLVGAVALMASGWVFFSRFVPAIQARRFAIWFMGLGLGLGYMLLALGRPVVFGSRTDALDWHMPELSAFYSILSLPHFIWAAAFQGVAIVLTLTAAERGSLKLGGAAALAWLGEESIHAQMPLLIFPALAIALVVRPVALRGYLAALVALIPALPYIGYSYFEYRASSEVLRWSAEWRNNLPPDAVSLAVALLPQLLLAAFALPTLARRRSRDDVFIVAWLVILVMILWLPNPAGNLRRRFFDGLYMPLVALAAQGMYAAVLPRLRTVSRRRLLPFAYVAFSAVGSLYLLVAPMLYPRLPEYSLTTSEYRGLTWLAGEPKGAVLSTAAIGLYIPAYSADSVYVGQYSETYDYQTKALAALSAISGKTSALSLAGQNHLRYVFWSSAASRNPPPGLGTPAYSAPGVRIWRLF